MKPFSDGMSAVKKDGLWGHINLGGTLCVENKYEIAFLFIGGIALVRIDDIDGYVDKQGNEYWQEDDVAFEGEDDELLF